MKFKEVMSTHLLTVRQLKKARRRYMAKIKPAIESDHALLWLFAKKMKERGLYSKSTFDRDIRFYILRSMHFADGCRRGTFDWSSWLLKNGWGQRWWDKCAA